MPTEHLSVEEALQLWRAFSSGDGATLSQLMQRKADSYLADKDTPEHQDKHLAKLRQLTGCVPSPRPWYMLESQEHACFNPLEELLWRQWARGVAYAGDDARLGMVKDFQSAADTMRQLAIMAMSFAVPSLPVLLAALEAAPGGRIYDIGAGTGYWARLLSELGAHVVAVDPVSTQQPQNARDFDVLQQDGVEFVRSGAADDGALMFIWPYMEARGEAIESRPDELQGPRPEGIDPDNDCMAERCLHYFKGDTVFWCGEVGEGCTFDMARWLVQHKQQGWYLAEELEIPQWPGLHDVFWIVKKRAAGADDTAVQTEPEDPAMAAEAAAAEPAVAEPAAAALAAESAVALATVADTAITEPAVVAVEPAVVAVEPAVVAVELAVVAEAAKADEAGGDAQQL